jgi:hypothetical protein
MEINLGTITRWLTFMIFTRRRSVAMPLGCISSLSKLNYRRFIDNASNQRSSVDRISGPYRRGWSQQVICVSFPNV